MRALTRWMAIAFLLLGGCGDDDSGDGVRGGGADGGTRAALDAAVLSDAGSAKDGTVACEASAFYGDEHPAGSQSRADLHSIRAPLDTFCAQRGCPTSFASARDEAVATELEFRGSDGSCQCLLRVINGCGVDTVEVQCPTGGSQWNFDHDTGELVGAAFAIDHLLYAADCEYREIHAGRARPACPEVQIEMPCESHADPDAGTAADAGR
jgi:hypothetical protein